jgi:hypothetical protein
MPIARPVLLLVVLAIACRADTERVSRNAEVETYLAGYSKEYQRLNYFEPLYQWLRQQNQGRKATLPDL